MEQIKKSKRNLTDEEIEQEIATLKKSPYVRLARKEERAKYVRRQTLYTLRALDKRGRELYKTGVSDEFLDEFNMSNTHIKAEVNKMLFEQFLKERKITQRELSTVLGVHQTLVSQWCHGKCKPNLRHVSVMAKYMDVPIDILIEFFN